MYDVDDVEVYIVGGVGGWSELLSGRVDISSSKQGWSTNFQLAGYQPRSAVALRFFLLLPYELWKIWLRSGMISVGDTY